MTQSFDDLFDALRKDDLETFRFQLLTYGWPKNSQWSDHHLLSESIKFGRKNVANFLLDLKCRVTKPDARSTLVHVALTYADWTELVVKLINLGSPVSTVNAAGDTAVHVAFKSNADGELIDLLLAAYVRETIMNIKDKEELSVLHIACSRPNLHVVQELTYRSNRVIVVREDLNGRVLSSNSTGYSRYTPMHFAVKNGHTEIVKFLCQHHHVDVYQVDFNSSTPLHLALELSDMEILDCLLAYDKGHGDAVNNIGLTHFMAACAGSNSSIAAEYLRLTQCRPWTSPQTLINNKAAEVSGSPYCGYSALHFAAAFGRLETVQLLLAHGASFFVVSAENLTPLVVAVKRGHEDVYRLLWRTYKAYRQAIYNAMDEEERRCVANDKTEVKNEVSKRTLSSDEQEKNVMEPESLSSKTSPVSNGLSSSRSSSPTGSNVGKSSMSPRPGLVEKKVGAKPPGFNSPTKYVSKSPPALAQ